MTTFQSLSELNLTLNQKLHALEQVSVDELLSIAESFRLVSTKLTDSWLFDTAADATIRRQNREKAFQEESLGHYPGSRYESIFDY